MKHASLEILSVTRGTLPAGRFCRGAQLKVGVGRAVHQK